MKSLWVLESYIRVRKIKLTFLIIVVMDGSSPAVSCLKVEPRVSTFPVIKSVVAVFITVATMKILGFGHI